MSSSDEIFTSIDLYCPSTLLDIIVLAAQELDCLGIEEKDTSSDLVHVVIYLADAKRDFLIEDRLIAILKSYNCTESEIKEVRLYTSGIPPFDWAAEVQKNYKSIQISDNLFIVPSWEQPVDKKGVLSVLLDPSRAFGTGRHESTKLCLLLLERVFDELQSNDELSMLDIGCGSGILSIYGALRGARKVVAIDTDPIAVDITKSNSIYNNTVSQIEVLCTTVLTLNQNFSLVVANIRREPILDFSDLVRQRVLPGGYVILSGLLREESSEIINKYIKSGFVLAQEQNMAEWTALLLRG